MAKKIERKSEMMARSGASVGTYSTRKSMGLTSRGEGNFAMDTRNADGVSPTK